MKSIIKSKKAQSISINTIVIAAIALIVLVVIIAIFGGQIRKFLTGASACSTQGGECLERIDCTLGLNTQVTGTDCDNKNSDGTDLQYEYVCCIPLFNKPE